jgi:tetratricopeptide (TPR) repeat protein
MAKKKERPEEVVEVVENTLSRTEQYIEDNQKSLTIIVLAIVIIVGGYLGFKKFIVEPQEKEAAALIFEAEHYFAIDSFRVALESENGFLEISDSYGLTKVGTLANYYAGICYLQLGEFENAIEYLNKFSSDDEMLMTLSINAIADANMQLGNIDDAVSYYKKASERKPNKFITPMILMKLGQTYEDLNDNKNALSVYKKIQSEYSDSNEGRNIRKYIAKMEYKLNN